MKLFTALLALTLLAPIALAEDDITVTLVVRTTAADAPHLHDCGVTVPSGSSVAEVLDQATEDGCILGWTCVDYGFDCFVDSVDHIPGAPMFASYWAFWLNGGYSDSGAYGTIVEAGDVVELEYEQGLLFPSPI